MKRIFRISGLRAFSALLAVSLALPVSWKGFTGFYAWLSPYIMLNSVFTVMRPSANTKALPDCLNDMFSGTNQKRLLAP